METALPQDGNSRPRPVHPSTGGFARHVVLGTYMLNVASAQLVLYATAAARPDLSALFYLDPRIGLFFLESFVRGGDSDPAVLSWVSVIVLGVLGVDVLRGPEGVRRYRAIEAALALPSVAFYLFVLAANIHPAHGFSVRELIAPVTVFTFATVIPVALSRGVVPSTSYGAGKTS